MAQCFSCLNHWELALTMVHSSALCPIYETPRRKSLSEMSFNSSCESPEELVIIQFLDAMNYVLEDISLFTLAARMLTASS